MRRLATWVAAFAAAGCSFRVPEGIQPPDDGGGDAPGDAPIDTGPCVGPDTDGDGKVDACDPCPADSPDDPDADGICTAADACPQGDDAADADGDAVPDACDDWPCGAKPAAPSEVVTWATPQENVTISLVDLAGEGRLVVATPQQELSLSAAYSIIDCECTNCIDQIEVGFVPGGKQACLYNGNPQGAAPSPGCLIATTGTRTVTLTTPATPGVYPVRFRRGNAASCTDTTTWWDEVEPLPNETVALVCVSP